MLLKISKYNLTRWMPHKSVQAYKNVCAEIFMSVCLGYVLAICMQNMLNTPEQPHIQISSLQPPHTQFAFQSHLKYMHDSWEYTFFCMTNADFPLSTHAQFFPRKLNWIFRYFARNSSALPYIRKAVINIYTDLHLLNKISQRNCKHNS